VRAAGAGVVGAGVAAAAAFAALSAAAVESALLSDFAHAPDNTHAPMRAAARARRIDIRSSEQL
jgi:3-hydroxyacyl-CoA dehydrogenase